MPIQLRQRLDCHYCGRRSKSSRKQDRRFQCEHCLAVNFFDENGEIADVPVEEAAPTQRFAQPVATDPLQDDFSAADSIFCSTCLKNQQLYTYNLSQFLPDPDDPEYDKLEAELPAYKKSLEQRYPQCCARCEPSVRARLHQATYNARSDHLRRVLGKSRQRRISSRLGWRSLLVSAAGLGYLLSLALQLLWHLYGSQISEQTFMPGFQPRHCIMFRQFVSPCLDVMEPVVGLSLAAGLSCIWWNPGWQHKLANSAGSLDGLDKYYLVQLALLGLRFSAWIVIPHVPLSTKVAAMLHACFAVAIAVIAGWSVFGIVKVKNLPPVNWHEDPAPLLSKQQFVPPPEQVLQETQQEQERGFNVGNLGASERSTYQEWRPPTPPEDNADSMDWTPSQPTFNPELKQVRYQSNEPTPFYGTLPALNAKGVKNKNQAGAREAIGIPPGFFDRPQKSSIPPRQHESSRDAMAEPRFFPPEKADTGLENIFGTVFSLHDRSLDRPSAIPRGHDTAATIAQPATDSEPEQRLHTTRSSPAVFSGISFFLLLIAVIVWIFEAAIATNTSLFGYYVVLLSACIPVSHLIFALLDSGVQGQFGHLLIYTLEASFLIGIAMLRDPFGELLRDLWNKMGVAAVALLLPQQFLQMNHATRMSDHKPAQITQTPYGDNQQKGVGHQATPRPPTLTRTDSAESIQSEASIATTSTVPEWATPKPDRPRFDVNASVGATARSKARQPSDRSMLGLDSLTLSDRPPTSARRGMGARNAWGLESSGMNIAGPRSRRGY
ncbi:Ima1 N-terminal domain-containing protein [Exophiala viscosa]|uniref:Ima1 N-terminal domain-containing protein n=1 Tax=Exophiala viscosa TaxID=2486360 RepID=UPI00219DCA95|nr:Ima1 N-terminal domain-containing protein [Exophiala viscosa]